MQAAFLKRGVLALSDILVLFQPLYLNLILHYFFQELLSPLGPSSDFDCLVEESLFQMRISDTGQVGPVFLLALSFSVVQIIGASGSGGLSCFSLFFLRLFSNKQFLYVINVEIEFFYPARAQSARARRACALRALGLLLYSRHT